VFLDRNKRYLCRRTIDYFGVISVYTFVLQSFQTELTFGIRAESTGVCSLESQTL